MERLGPVRASVRGGPKVGVAQDPNPGAEVTGPGVARAWVARVRGAGLQVRPLQAGKPDAGGSLTSTVDAPAHSALLALPSARGRRRDQHRGGRTAPGISVGAGRGAANREAGSPAPNSTADWL